MIIHFYNVSKSTYFDPWYKILEEITDPSEHKVVLFGKPENKLYEGNGTLNKRILYCYSFQCLPKLIFNIFKSKRVMVHFLDPHWKKLLIYLLATIMGKKVTWMIWGGDLYYWLLNTNREGVRKRVQRYLFKFLLSGIDEITCLVKEDYDIAKEYLGAKAKYRYLFYPNPIDFALLDKAIEELSTNNDDSVLRILVGNSADPSNNHFEILDVLYKLYAQRDVEIICPLSYGNFDYAHSVIEYGKKTFGSRFIALTELIDPSEYAKLLLKVKVAVFNHRRQQALGNILALLYAKKKVYIRSDISTWKFLERYGIRVYDTKKLLNGEDIDFEQFNEQIAQENSQIVRREFGKEKCAELWKKAFEDYLQKK